MILPIDCCSVLDGYWGEEIETDRSSLQRFPQTIPPTLSISIWEIWASSQLVYSGDAYSITYLRRISVYLEIR